MPKRYRDTKRFQADELFRRLEHGPCYSFDVFGLDFNKDGLTQEMRAKIQEQFEHDTRLWLSSWITPVVDELLPKELKRRVR